MNTSDRGDSLPHPGMDVSDLRRSATGLALEREDLLDDPVLQFERWFRDA